MNGPIPFHFQGFNAVITTVREGFPHYSPLLQYFLVGVSVFEST
jgi:hypothetical protein